LSLKHTSAGPVRNRIDEFNSSETARFHAAGHAPGAQDGDVTSREIVMFKGFKQFGAALAMLVAVAATEAPAQAPDAGDARSTSIAMVEVPRPWYAPRGVIVDRMRQSVPTYAAAPGLLEKHFTLSDQRTLGGLYRWDARASADAFFNDAWRARILAQYGEAAAMAWFDSPLALDGPDAGAPLGDDAVALVVRVPVPAGTPRERIAAGFEQSAPAYRAAPGLRRKWFIITDDGRIGGVYLWSNAAAADAFFNDAWRARVRATYGVDADIRRFEAPLIVAN
jgi:hypothetical protein